MLSGLVLSGIGDAFACISRNKCDVVPSATILTSKLGRLLGREYPWGGGMVVAGTFHHGVVRAGVVLW